MPGAGRQQRVLHVGRRHFALVAQFLVQAPYHGISHPGRVASHHAQCQSRLLILADALERLVPAEPENLEVTRDVFAVLEQVAAEHAGQLDLRYEGCEYEKHELALGTLAAPSANAPVLVERERSVATREGRKVPVQLREPSGDLDFSQRAKQGEIRVAVPAARAQRRTQKLLELKTFRPLMVDRKTMPFDVTMRR